MVRAAVGERSAERGTASGTGGFLAIKSRRAALRPVSGTSLAHRVGAALASFLAHSALAARRRCEPRVGHRAPGSRSAAEALGPGRPGAPGSFRAAGKRHRIRQHGGAGPADGRVGDRHEHDGDHPHVEGADTHRRLGTHRLQDRGLAGRSRGLDRAGEEHPVDGHDLRAHRAERGDDALLPGVGDQPLLGQRHAVGGIRWGDARDDCPAELASDRVRDELVQGHEWRRVRSPEDEGRFAGLPDGPVPRRLHAVCGVGQVRTTVDENHGSRSTEAHRSSRRAWTRSARGPGRNPGIVTRGDARHERFISSNLRRFRVDGGHHAPTPQRLPSCTSRSGSFGRAHQREYRRCGFHERRR